MTGILTTHNVNVVRWWTSDHSQCQCCALMDFWPLTMSMMSVDGLLTTHNVNDERWWTSDVWPLTMSTMSVDGLLTTHNFNDECWWTRDLQKNNQNVNDERCGVVLMTTHNCQSWTLLYFWPLTMSMLSVDGLLGTHNVNDERWWTPDHSQLHSTMSNVEPYRWWAHTRRARLTQKVRLLLRIQIHLFGAVEVHFKKIVCIRWSNGGRDGPPSSHLPPLRMYLFLVLWHQCWALYYTGARLEYLLYDWTTCRKILEQGSGAQEFVEASLPRIRYYDLN